MSKKRTYDAGHPRLVSRGRQRERQGEDLYLSSLRASLKTAATRLVFAEWMVRGNLFTAASPDETPTQMAYHEGRRSIALEMQASLELADAALVTVLWQEHRRRLEQQDAGDAAALVDALEEKPDA